MDKDYIVRSPVSAFLFTNKKASWFWLIVRLYVGWEWLHAGWEKIINPDQVWVGDKAGVALSGFLQGAMKKAGGDYPDVQWWYAWFLQHVVASHPIIWSYLVTYGEVLVGVALIIGAFTGIAAFFGMFMNLNYLLAGTVSVNPILFCLGLGLLLAWRIAGDVGLDRYLMPKFGTPWSSKKVFPQVIT